MAGFWKSDRLVRLYVCALGCCVAPCSGELYAQTDAESRPSFGGAWPNAAAYTAAAQAVQPSQLPQAASDLPRPAPLWPQPPQLSYAAADPAASAGVATNSALAAAYVPPAAPGVAATAGYYPPPSAEVRTPAAFAAFQPGVTEPSPSDAVHAAARPEPMPGDANYRDATDSIGGEIAAAGAKDTEVDDASADEPSVVELQDEIKGLREDLDSLSDKNFVFTGTSNSSMRFGGRIHLDAWGFANDNDVVDGPGFEGEDPQNRLIVRRLRLTVQGDVRENMIYKMDLEISEPNDASFRDAYIGFEELSVLQTVIIGNHKRPYGLDHINSSNFNVFLERPFVVEAFNEDNRRLGISSNGFSEDLRYNWRYGVYNQEVVQDSGQYIGDPLQLELAGRLATTAWYDEISDGRGYLHLAIAGTAADPDSDDDFAANAARFRTRPEARSTNRWIDTGRIAGAENFELLALESVLNVGALQLVGEYQTVQVNRTRGFDDVDFDGYYVYAAYFLTGEHMPWDRQTGQLDDIVPFENFWMVDRCGGGHSVGWGAWQVAARYSEADYTDDDIFGGVGEAYTLGLNWYWNSNARMQFNYVDGRIGERTAALSNGEYQIYGVRSMLFF